MDSSRPAGPFLFFLGPFQDAAARNARDPGPKTQNAPSGEGEKPKGGSAFRRVEFRLRKNPGEMIARQGTGPGQTGAPGRIPPLPLHALGWVVVAGALQPPLPEVLSAGVAASRLRDCGSLLPVEASQYQGRLLEP